MWKLFRHQRLSSRQGPLNLPRPRQGPCLREQRAQLGCTAWGILGVLRRLKSRQKCRNLGSRQTSRWFCTRVPLIPLSSTILTSRFHAGRVPRGLELPETNRLSNTSPFGLGSPVSPLYCTYDDADVLLDGGVVLNGLRLVWEPCVPRIGCVMRGPEQCEFWD